ncbi:MAG: SDR family NAD(P)-dependent oxidoreductase [Acidimicrobiales bacterium]|nr:SDR family NAD(P)-dependent oxidoreductase [Acidimicrobiales bacterium]
MQELSGRVAVVTGGASGIGRAMAQRFVAAGMEVVIADVEEAPLAATAAELGVHPVRTDVADAASVQALADEVVARFGAVHVLCNNAGVGGGGVMSSLTLNDWKWVIDVNLWGVVHGLQSFLPLLLANDDGGHVVNTASMAGLSAWPGIGPYNATKYAVVGISETLAVELADTRVGVSVLCPGVVNTNIFESQRNRPAALRNPQRNPGARAANSQVTSMSGIDPALVADQVHDAIVDGRFWILTHPELVEHVVRRTDSIVDAARR